MNIKLVDIVTAMPETIITNDYFGEAEIREKNRMFSGTKERRHLTRDETASELMAKGISILTKRNPHFIESDGEIDMILTNVSLPDECFTGCGAVVNKKANLKAKYIFDIHNTGCVSFIYLLELAHTYMASGKIKNALICTAQTSAGRVFGQSDTRDLAQSAIPGDGCAVALVSSEEGHSFLGFQLDNFPKFSEDMYGNYGGAKWWEPRSKTGKIDFSEEKTAKIVARGNKLVPESVYKVCDDLKMKVTDLNFFITNQPNKNFLRNWREAIQMSEENHLDTFEKYANLFGAGIPVTLSEAIEESRFKKGDLICLAGFSHAGDYSASTILEW